MFRRLLPWCVLVGTLLLAGCTGPLPTTGPSNTGKTQQGTPDGPGSGRTTGKVTPPDVPG
jgi:hypothetical protein